MIILVFYKVEASFKHLRMNNRSKFLTFFFFNLNIETFKILKTYNKQA